MKNNTLFKITAISFVASLLLSGCGGGGGGSNDTSTIENKADVDSEIYSHRAWDELMPPEDNSNVLTGTEDNVEVVVDEDVYSCSVDSYSLTKNPAEFVMVAPDQSIMWLGNLIQGESHLALGSLRELSVRERAPLTISLDILTGDNSRTVDIPSLSTVNMAVGELIQSAIDNNVKSSPVINFQKSEAHSSSQGTLDLGFSAEYLGSSFEAEFEIDNSAAESTYYAYYIERAFTVTIAEPVTPGEFFSDNYTQEMLQRDIDNENISANNPPLYISSITYGRILLYKMTSTYEKERMLAAMEASYSGASGGVGGYGEAELLETLQTADIEITAVGGNNEGIANIIRTGNLEAYFEVDNELSQYRPISFEVKTLVDNQRAGIVRTTEYDIRACEFTGTTRTAIGEEVRVIFDKVYVPADCDNFTKGAGDIIGRFDVIYGDENNNQVTRRLVTIPQTKVDSKTTMTIRDDWRSNSDTFYRYYDHTFRFSGNLTDVDDGPDDKVGDWNANQNDISTKRAGTYTRNATSNCSKKQPTLTYRIEYLGPIYE